MALRQAGLISRSEGQIALVLAPRAGESLRVRQIEVTNPGVGTLFATIINDTARVGFFRVAGTWGGGPHLQSQRVQEVDAAIRGCNMLKWMTKQEAFAGYPVVEGETFTIQLNQGTADIFVVYDSYDSADVKSTEPNGSKSTTLMYMNYGTNAGLITAAGYNKVDASNLPQEMTSFPFGPPGAGLLPSGKKCDVLFIGGSPVGRLNGAGLSGATAYLRAHVGAAPAQAILDRNDVGVLFVGDVPGAGVSWAGLRTSVVSNPRDAFDLDDWLPLLTFNGNDELALQYSNTLVGGAGSQIDIGDVDVWALLKIYPAS